MSRTVIPVLRSSRFIGLDITVGAAGFIAGDVANGNVAANDGFTALLVRNSDGSNAHNVTVTIPTNVDGTQTVTSRNYPIPAGKTQSVGIFPVQFYSNQIIFNADSATLLIAPVTFLNP